MILSGIASSIGSIVLVQDALPFIGGAERVLDATLQVYPQAPIYTLVYHPSAFQGTVFEGHSIHSAWVSRLPGARRHYRVYLALFPWVVEQFDLSSFELILSFSYAVAHGVIPRPDQLHISYTYTPMRYAWQQYHDYMRTISGPRAWLARLVLHYFRMWDLSASARVDYFVAISRWVADCIWRAYRRPAEVIYPPVDVDRFQPHEPRQDYYITVTRLEPHKRVSLIVDAFSHLGLPLYVVGEGSQSEALRERAAPNISFLGSRPEPALVELLGRARAFVHAAEEDFGIAPVEAQAAGCPVIAYGKGGVRETVLEGQTGLFFPEQSVQSLAEAVRVFEENASRFSVSKIRKNAERFRVDRFQHQLAELVEREWARFQSGERSRTRER